MSCWIADLAANAAFGATRSNKHWLDKVLGRRATDTTDATEGDYGPARAAGHLVTALIHCLWGGLAPDAAALLRDLDRHNAGRLGTDAARSSTWTAGSVSGYYGQLFSIASAKGVAEEYFRWLDSDAAADVRSLADHPGLECLDRVSPAMY